MTLPPLEELEELARDAEVEGDRLWSSRLTDFCRIGPSLISEIKRLQTENKQLKKETDDSTEHDHNATAEAVCAGGCFSSLSAAVHRCDCAQGHGSLVVSHADCSHISDGSIYS